MENNVVSIFEKIIEYRNIISDCDSKLKHNVSGKKEIRATKKRTINNVKKCLSTIKRALKNSIEQDKPRLFSYLASCYEILGNKAKALKYYKEASNRDPIYIVELAIFKSLNNDHFGAIQDMRLALQNANDANDIERMNFFIKSEEEKIKDKHIKDKDNSIPPLYISLLAILFKKLLYYIAVIIGAVLLIAIPVGLILLLIKHL